LLRYGWLIDLAESNRGRSNAGPSLIRAWTNLAGQHGWRLKDADMLRSYGLNLVPFITDMIANRKSFRNNKRLRKV
jgi:hypothetical protein